MKPFDYCEKKILKKTSFRIAICILYFVLNMMARSIYRTFQMLEYGNGYQSSLVYIVLSEIMGTVCLRDYQVRIKKWMEMAAG